MPDLFADPFISAEMREKQTPAGALHCLASSIQLVCEILARLSSLVGNGRVLRAVELLQHAMAESAQIGARIPLLSAAEAKDDAASAQKRAGQVYEFLNVFVAKVNSLRVGQGA